MLNQPFSPSSTLAFRLASASSLSSGFEHGHANGASMSPVSRPKSVIRPLEARPVSRRLALTVCTPDETPPVPAINHYETLQVKPFADAAAIRRAYRRLARHAHPDVNQSADATQYMQAVNQAYAVLRDPVNRAEYDRARIARALQEAAAGISTPNTALVASHGSCSRRQKVRRALGAAFTVLASPIRSGLNS